MIAYTLRYVGNTPRSNPDMHWCVDTASDCPKHISFWYFATLADAVRTYPKVREQAIRFHLEHAKRELNDYAAPGCDDPSTIRLINERIDFCLANL